MSRLAQKGPQHTPPQSIVLALVALLLLALTITVVLNTYELRVRWKDGELQMRPASIPSDTRP